MKSLGLYSGVISHHRSHPLRHRFDYKMVHVCLDLQRLDLLDKISLFWSSKRRNLVRFNDNNYFAGEDIGDTNLYQRVCEKIFTDTGKPFKGKAYLLANLSYWGHCYNPVVFVCCYENSELSYLIAEVHNTPWGERFAYVHDVKAQMETQDEAGFYHADFDKSFHVSPFMPMDLRYHWTYKISDSHFFIDMNLLEKGKSIFNATLDFEGESLSSFKANLLPFRYPFMCLKVLVAIYWQAFRLWLKKIPIFPHN